MITSSLLLFGVLKLKKNKYLTCHLQKQTTLMNSQVPKLELKSRMIRFRDRMNKQHPEWKMAVVFSKINLLYFTGSMPDGMLIIQREEKEILWVRRSFERTRNESVFEDIRPMNSYRDAATSYTVFPKCIFLETEFVPLAMFERFQKYFPVSNYQSLDYELAMVRAVKSKWELSFMRKAGTIHQKILEEDVPKMLHEGMSEVDLAAELYNTMLKAGHMGIARFNMFDTEMAIAQLGFGESSLYPSNFNGPGGHYGMSAAMPGIGSRERFLKKGELVFVDMGLAVNGYHTDKTLSYQFGAKIPQKAIETHKECVSLQYQIAELLRPGYRPSEIYETIINGLSSEFLQDFMGFGNRQSKFLGHAIGLTVDELPVLAKGFDEPLEENMVFAVEPKKGVAGIGLMGIENTFVVKPNGGECITGNHEGLIEVF